MTSDSGQARSLSEDFCRQGDYARFSARAMAMLIDLILANLLYCSCFCATAVRGIIHAPLPFSGLYHFLLQAPFFFLSFPLFIAVYFLVPTAWHGQTPGKWFMGIMVVQSDGLPPGPGHAFLRLTGYGLSLLPLGLGFIQAAFHAEACAWHDLLAGTRVVAVGPERGESVLN